MKPLLLQAAVFMLGFTLALCGCQHKKPVLVMPQQPPSTATPAPSPTPESAATTQPAEQTQEPAQQAQTASSEQPKSEPGEKEKSRHGKKPSPRKTGQQPATGEKGTTEIARNAPGKKIIPADKAEPTPTPGQISPGGGTQDQAAIEQLLQSAETNLNGIKRQLTKDEEAKRTQAKEFISQSRKAITENDPTRAHTLAVKARVLSDELVKQP
jgi:hypothetical protein